MSNLGVAALACLLLQVLAQDHDIPSPDINPDNVHVDHPIDEQVGNPWSHPDEAIRATTEQTEENYEEMIRNMAELERQYNLEQYDGSGHHDDTAMPAEGHTEASHNLLPDDGHAEVPEGGAIHHDDESSKPKHEYDIGALFAAEGQQADQKEWEEVQAQASHVDVTNLRETMIDMAKKQQHLHQHLEDKMREVHGFLQEELQKEQVIIKRIMHIQDKTANMSEAFRRFEAHHEDTRGTVQSTSDMLATIQSHSRQLQEDRDNLDMRLKHLEELFGGHWKTSQSNLIKVENKLDKTREELAEMRTALAQTASRTEDATTGGDLAGVKDELHEKIEHLHRMHVEQKHETTSRFYVSAGALLAVLLLGLYSCFKARSAGDKIHLP